MVFIYLKIPTRYRYYFYLVSWKTSIGGACATSLKIEDDILTANRRPRNHFKKITKQIIPSRTALTDRNEKAQTLNKKIVLLTPMKINCFFKKTQ